jgi:hypothetical protein
MFHHGIDKIQQLTIWQPPHTFLVGVLHFRRFNQRFTQREPPPFPTSAIHNSERPNSITARKRSNEEPLLDFVFLPHKIGFLRSP